MPAQILPVALGAVFGALTRWLLGLALAHTAAPFAISILAANWAGAFAVGLCAELVHNPQWRLLLITGFLGSLTTLSAFSLETVALMQAQRWGAALVSVLLHVFGSFALTALGMWTAQFFK
ncbi:fluoride efflux transporter CrcB [Neisseria chenwenguii]|uniref:Fluoride-specific ion channel FluC n=1 Tax=Neisseria chenwenguii TaxID=1853278 RepID=A0A220S479_9NEIS|nr:fluoride efflux transporter CrcB [Neisseria chenwenguii]ASK28304.1 fluoride ion transporter CrcB [Neisseria chenwenguii]ROV55471.1 fluoride efflux transporter CrcB [Neisseria chenwenguii]